MNTPVKILVGLIFAAVVFAAGLVTGRYLERNPLGSKVIKANFRAVTKFQILISNPPEFPNLIMEQPSFSLETELKVLASREVLLRVVHNLNLVQEWNMPPDEAAARLERMIEVEQERGTNIVSVIAWSNKTQEAAEIANGVREAYEEFRTNIEEDRARRLTAAVEIQNKELEKEVEKSRLAMLDIQRKHNIVDLAPVSGSGQPAEPLPPYDSEAKDPAAERTRQSEYATAKSRYESTLQLLNSVREHALRAKVDNGVLKRAVEVLEVATPPRYPER